MAEDLLQPEGKYKEAVPDQAGRRPVPDIRVAIKGFDVDREVRQGSAPFLFEMMTVCPWRMAWECCV
jgi:hypothetical protein